MRVIDERGKLFGVINGLDLFIVLLVFVGIAIIGLKFFRNGPQISNTAKKVQYSIEVKDKPEDFVEVMHIGDTIKDSTKNNYLGKLVDIQTLPAVIMSENIEEGKFVKVELPNRVDIILTIESKCIETPNYILAEGIDLKIGKGFFIKGKGYAASGVVVNIQMQQ